MSLLPTRNNPTARSYVGFDRGTRIIFSRTRQSIWVWVEPVPQVFSPRLNSARTIILSCLHNPSDRQIVTYFSEAPRFCFEVTAVPIACPYCEHRINLKAAKAGRYRSRCPKCERPFALNVPRDDTAIEVRALEIEETIANRASAKSELAVAGSRGSSHIAGFEPTNADPRRRNHSITDFEDAPEVENSNEDYAAPRTDVHGYRIVRELGRGGMGAVFLAQQLSLDRPVALKVMAKRWASDPTFVARFTREAYAAAQLCHPNIVQIHDIGEVDGGRFFSMEFVPGRSLAEVVRKHGKLDPETAVGYILQAARGLKHAHDRGMIHRDVKPDNLLLDHQGLVKVADLGLVKTPALSREDDALATSRGGLNSIPANLTGARIALGTPAYMSPEQCRDAATVDRRADVYSLGCTLYVMVTGRPPFHGTTAIELMTKQAYEPIVPPERIVARVPAELSAVIQRMLAKSPDDRFQSMDDVIRTLEAWLGIRTAGSFCPREEEIAKLEGLVHAFNASPRAVLRGRLVQGFAALAVFASILLLFFGRAGWSFGVVSLLVQTAAAYFVVDGIARKGVLFTRARQFAWGLGWWDWAIALAAFGMFVLLLAMSGLFWIGVAFGIMGIGLAFAVHLALDRPIDAERRGPVDACEKLLRRFRAQGLDEGDLRQFAAKFSGRKWEGFFEALFGYEAKLTARAALLRGGSSGPREKYASWREPILNAMTRIESTRRESRERKMLAVVERARLLSEGAAQDVAQRQASATADAMVRTAYHIRRSATERSVGTLMSGASDPEFNFEPSKPESLGRLVALVVGPHVRTAIAALLLAGCGIWAHQNALLPGSEVQAQVQSAVEASDLAGLERTAALDRTRKTTPLAVEGVPSRFTGWVDSFNVGIAGLLLMGSLCFRGNAMSLMVLAGAGVAVVGHQLGVRTVEPVSDYHVALLLGAVIALIGFRFGSR